MVVLVAATEQRYTRATGTGDISMPVRTVKRGNRYRLLESGSRRLARNTAGTPIDGGGHASAGKASRQARAVNASLSRKRQ